MASTIQKAFSCACLCALLLAPRPSLAAEDDAHAAAPVADAKVVRTIHAPGAAYCDLSGTVACSFAVTSPAAAASASAEPGPAGGLSVTDAAAELAAPADGSSVQIHEAGLAVDASKFAHAGVYEYLLGDPAPEGLPAGWRWSDDCYRVRVYLRNGGAADGGARLVCTGITAGRLEGGVAAAASQDGAKAAKVDVTDGIRFESSYDATSTLTFAKAVAGDYGDKSHAFVLACTLTLPDYVDAPAELSYDVVAADGSVLSAGRKAAVEGRSCTISESLSDGQRVIVRDVPVGTSYALIEPDSTWRSGAYVPSGTFTYSSAVSGDASCAVTAGSAGQKDYQVSRPAASNAADDVRASTTVGSGANNQATITNTLDEGPSPTGIAIASAPYALIAGLAALGIAAGAWSRRMRSRG